MKMIVVRGAVVGTAATFEELKRICLEHTRRSRLEPGCISHEVSVDVEDAHKLIFFERWENAEALKTHFAVPESIAMVKALRKLSGSPGEIYIYDAETIRV